MRAVFLDGNVRQNDLDQIDDAPEEVLIWNAVEPVTLEPSMVGSLQRLSIRHVPEIDLSALAAARQLSRLEVEHVGVVRGIESICGLETLKWLQMLECVGVVGSAGLADLRGVDVNVGARRNPVAFPPDFLDHLPADQHNLWSFPTKYLNQYKKLARARGRREEIPMGTWGYGVFQNDSAADLAGEVDAAQSVDEVAEVIGDCFDELDAGDDPDDLLEDEVRVGAAAAAIVAIAFGAANGAGAYGPEVWIAGTWAPSEQLVRRSRDLLRELTKPHGESQWDLWEGDADAHAAYAASLAPYLATLESRA